MNRKPIQAMIHVLAFITAKPGRRAAVLDLFRANMPAVQAEDGCLEYRPVLDAEGFGAAQAPLGPDSFVVVEKWRDGDCLRAHAASAHMRAYGEASAPMLASRAIHILSDA